MNKEKMLADSLEIYIREKHTQEECIGFIDGFKEALRQLENICDHNRVEVEEDDFGNTHFCSKCKLWNF